MNRTVKSRALDHSSKEFSFKLRPVAAACALAIFASGASAQQAAPATDKAAEAAKAEAQKKEAAKKDAAKVPPVENFVVTAGIRRGIEDAISVKQNSTSIVESISAEDIGKLPDVSIAESISRLPGLAAQRVAGRAQVISVRGLSPDFATTLLNGREQVSTGDNRSVEFDQYPSELLSAVTVYKTPDSSLVGQGLSGTLDMQTVRPLSFGGRAVSVNVRGEKNSLGDIANAKATGNRVSVTYIDQLANKTVGVAFGYSRLESPILEQQVGLYEPWETPGRNGVPSGTQYTNGIKSLARSGKNTREGFMGVLEIKASNEWTTTFDLYSSKFDREDTANQFEANLGDYNGGFAPGLRWSSVNVVNGVLQGGVATGLYPLVRGIYTKREDKLSAFGWNNRFQFDGWSLLADANISTAKRDELSLENNLQLARTSASTAPLDSLTLAWNTGGFPTMRPGLSYSDATRLFVDNTIYGSGYGKTPKVEDELKGYKLVASFPLGTASSYFSDIDVGLNFAERTKKKRQPEGGINLRAGPTTIAGDLQYSRVDLGFSGSGVIPAWNVPGVVSRYMMFAPTDTLNYLISKGWDVTEKVTTSFIKANLDGQLGSVSLRGNVGVQVQNTDQSSNSRYYDGTAPAASQVKPVTDSKSYTDVLPSVNLAFGLGNEQTLRLAVAKQLARPRVDQLRSALDFGVSNVDFKPGGSGGNTKLDPWRANAFDISYEKYFGNKAYVAVAGFYKDLRSYIYTQSQNYDFSRFTPGTIARTNFGNYTAPYNGQGGKLKGAELSISLPMSMIAKELDGFGIVASASYSDSAIKIQDPSSNIGANIPLPGLSKNVTNLTAYYEKHGFSARISQRKRDDFVGEIGNFANDRTLRYVVGETIVDAQLGYSINQGMFKGLSFVLQANNLNNQPYQTYAGSRDRPYEYIKYGRTVLFGVNYKM
ncbi:MAG: TonB-dependent receptor [Rhodocyclaceae bacterium]|nr:TonB-dependent receptor [Rhodocyclaceae bacterium]